jgi:hypothetical protein
MGEPLVQNQYQRIGDPGAQLITQGLSFFLAAEVAYRLSPHWALIGSLRGGGILFPKIPQTTALGDIASVSGLVPRVSAVLGLAVGIGR